MITKIDLGIILQQIWFGLAGIKGFNPNVSESDRWKEWSSALGITTCAYCAEQDGKIFDENLMPEILPLYLQIILIKKVLPHWVGKALKVTCIMLPRMLQLAEMFIKTTIINYHQLKGGFGGKQI